MADKTGGYRIPLTLHQTKNSKGFHFEARTQFAEGYRPTLEENGEERYQKAIQPECLPEITMGAFYIEELDDYEDLSSADENNNFLIDPNTVDSTRWESDPEAMEIQETSEDTRWNNLVEESSYRYTTTMREDPPKIKIINIRGGNGE